MTLFQDELFKNVDVFLFCTIFNVDCISPKISKQNVTFELTMGQRNSWDEKTSHCFTAPMPISTNNHNNYLDYRNIKPCLYLSSNWPDNRHRMFNSNIISKITEKLVGTQNGT